MNLADFVGEEVVNFVANTMAQNKTEGTKRNYASF